MSFRSKVLDLLKEKECTSKDIQTALGGDLKLIQVYLNEFKNEGKIKKIGNEGKFFIYRVVENDNYSKLKKGYTQFNILFKELTEQAHKIINNNQIDNFKQLINENINIELIKELNVEMNI